MNQRVSFSGIVVLAVAGAALARPPVSVTIPSAKDNTLYDNATGSLSNGAGPGMFVGETGGGGVRRGLIAFDVAAIVPAGATITGATLNLNLSQASSPDVPASIELHAALAAWGEGASIAEGGGGGGAPSAAGDATWIHTFYPGSFWTNAGGDFDTAVLAAASVLGPGPYNWSSAGLTSRVQAWLNSPATNFGLLLTGDETTNATAKKFETKESANVANRPTLTIYYTPPCIGDINGDGQVNTSDLTALLGHFGQTVAPGTNGDLDGNGFVNTLDLTSLLGHFGVVC